MAIVFIPALLRDLTGGVESIALPGSTVRELVDELEARFPGVKTRILEEDHLRPGITVVVDGAVTHQRLRHHLEPGSEVHFLPAISGG